MKVQRNAPCPCGSGKKYKHCCLMIDLQGAGGAQIEIDNSKKVSVVAAFAVLATVGATYAEDLSMGLTVGAASILLGWGYITFSNPPPPKEDAGNPAGLDFGRKD